jgi:hypothetical protein
MKQGRYIPAFLLGIVITGALLSCRQESEPSYHGHQLSWWVDLYGNSYPDQRNPEDVEALTAIGTNALPYLINWIRDANDEKEGKRAGSAAAIFLILGTNANSCIPELKALVADPTNGNVCVLAERALVNSGPDGFAAVLEVIATPGIPQRGVLMEGGVLADHMRPTDATTMVGQGDPNFRINSIRAAPVLLKCLGDKDEVARRSAFLMLGFSDPGVMVPALTNFLASSPSPSSRRQATEALAKHGTNALDAVPFLLSRFGNSDPDISIEASNALLQIAPDALAKGRPQSFQ